MSALQTWTINQPYIQISSLLGEAPFCEKHEHGNRKRVRFFDILRGQIYIVDLDLGDGTESVESHHVGTISTSADIEGNDEEIIVGAQSGFAILNRRTYKVDYVCKVWEEGRDGVGKEDRMRFNDGAVDPQGRYWAGTMNNTSVEPPINEGVLFRLDSDGSVHRMIEHVTIPNGMAWTLDGLYMYFTDSPTRNIFRYRFDGTTGNISEQEVFFHLERQRQRQQQTDDEWPVPDGLAQDVEGNLWVALYGGGKVLKVNTAGKVIGEIHLPTRNITCPAFVGTELYITSAAENEPDKYPESVEWGGSLFRVDVGVEGAPVHKFKWHH